MKQRTLWIALLALYLPGAGAVDFNTDALKSMQEEGHKIVEESQGLRAFKLSGGQWASAHRRRPYTDAVRQARRHLLYCGVVGPAGGKPAGLLA